MFRAERNLALRSLEAIEMATAQNEQLKKQSEELIFREILATDQLLYGYDTFAYNLLNATSINAMNPSEVWSQIMWDQLLAMVVYTDMEEKDDCIASSLETRKDGVLSLPRRVLPASNTRQDKKVAEFVEETLEGRFRRGGESYFGFDQILYEMLDGMAKGVAIGEIVFGDGGDHVYISDVKFKPQHMFSFADGPMAAYSTPSYLGLQTGQLRLRMPLSFNSPLIGENGELPEGRFAVATYRPRYGNRWGGPQLRKVFWPSWFKRMSLKQWLRYLEKGSGSVVTKYNDGAGNAEKQLALDTARAINEESAVAIPKKFLVEVLEHVRQSMGGAYEGMADGVCNNAIMRVILGQTLTSRGSEGGGSRALGDVHNQVRAEKKEADAKFCMRHVNKCFVPPLVLFKFGPNARLPYWTMDYEPKRNLSADSIIHSRLAGDGLEIPKKFIYKNYQIPEPAEGEAVLKPLKQASTPETGVDSAANFAETPRVKKLVEMAELLDGLKVTNEQKASILGKAMEVMIQSEANFAEKKTPKSGKRPSSRSELRMERFSRLRPSVTEFSNE